MLCCIVNGLEGCFRWSHSRCAVPTAKKAYVQNNDLKGVKWVDTLAREKHKKGFCCCTPVKWCLVVCYALMYTWNSAYGTVYHHSNGANGVKPWRTNTTLERYTYSWEIHTAVPYQVVFWNLLSLLFFSWRLQGKEAWDTSSKRTFASATGASHAANTKRTTNANVCGYFVCFFSVFVFVCTCVVICCLFVYDFDNQSSRCISCIGLKQAP